MSVPIAPTSLVLLSKRCGLVNTVIRRTAAVSSRYDRPASAASVSAPKPSTQHTSKMHAWQLHSFGGVEQLSLSDSVRIPMLAGPNDVLVQISTTSVNPIDLAMLGENTQFFTKDYIFCLQILFSLHKVSRKKYVIC